MTALSTTLLTIMLALSPTGRHSRESADDGATRYASIVRDATTAVELDGQVFTGDQSRTVALLLAISYHESAWRLDVDDGRTRGDGGRSWCLAQLNVGTGQTWEGWTGPELVADRTKCFRAALRLVKLSLGACRSLPVADRLAQYASGSCLKGREESRGRWTTYERIARGIR
jgi:hypothetical protein